MEPRGRQLRSCLGHDQILEILGEPSRGSCPPSIGSISSDDRQLPADLFVAIDGHEFDATTRIKDVISAGVQSIVTETDPPLDLDRSICWWKVKDARHSLAWLEQAGAGFPGRSLRVFGITGTNGKSTTVQYLSSILKTAGRDVGWMTTVEKCIGSSREAARATTESPAEIADALACHHAAGGTDMVLEVSSHAIDQHRVAGVPLEGAAITTLGRDHLDYHNSIKEYHATKFRLRELCNDGAPFLHPVEKQKTGCFGYLVAAPDGEIDEVTAEVLESTLSGTVARIRLKSFEREIHIRQPGIYNVSNALCAIALADACGISEAHIVEGIESAASVPGRLEAVEGGPGKIFIDFAHTPEAIEQVLQSIRPMVSGRLLVLFGCGGDRDRGKRPLMGAAVTRYADELFVTSDNPRSEDPERIIHQISEGIGMHQLVRKEVDRRKAISNALDTLEENDVLIIAGKGHEATQEIDGHKFPFNDCDVVRELIAQSHEREGELTG